MKDTTLQQLNVLRHSLGLNAKGHGRRYRNHFCTGPGSEDYDDCCAMVAAGYMQRTRTATELSGGDDVFTVTPEGIALVEATKDPEAVLTRSQNRYRSYLRSETDQSFGEWLQDRRYETGEAPASSPGAIAEAFIEGAAATGSNDDELELLQGAVRSLLDLVPRNRLSAAQRELNALLTNG